MSPKCPVCCPKPRLTSSHARVLNEILSQSCWADLISYVIIMIIMTLLFILLDVEAAGLATLFLLDF